MKLATHVSFDEGVNDLSVDETSPNAQHFQRIQFGQPFPADSKESAVALFCFNTNHFNSAFVETFERFSATVPPLASHLDQMSCATVLVFLSLHSALAPPSFSLLAIDALATRFKVLASFVLATGRACLRCFNLLPFVLWAPFTLRLSRS